MDLRSRSYVWLDLIFVNINNNEIPFEKYIKPLSDRWEKFWPIKDRELIKYSNDFGYFNLNAKCNWKFAIENYCESYHLHGFIKVKFIFKIMIIIIFKVRQIVLPDKELLFIIQDLKVRKISCFPNWPKDKEHIAEYFFISNVILEYTKTIFMLIGWNQLIANTQKNIWKYITLEKKQRIQKNLNL